VPRYRDDAKEKVRDAVDFVALVGAKTELRRSSGSGFMGICPFHDERSPSFSVDAAKKVFHCFGCGESGDVYRFVELTEGVDFRGALELLADRHGVELEIEDEDPQAAQRRQRREKLLELLERTAAFYVRHLWESQEAARARAYLAERGLEEATLRQFRVGYSPSRWDTVLTSSTRSGFKARDIYDAGLAARRGGEGRMYDYFRGRIMFPLADLRGRVLGFGARQLDTSDRGPKYLNTKDNDLFHKGRIVYAADLARAQAAKAGAVIVCEGYTDVLALHQAGVVNAVASMGTALTEEQVIELGRMAPTVQLALDADDAGQEAMLRAARVAAGRKLELRVVPLPEGRDPADVALADDGAEAVRALVARSVPFVRFRVERTLTNGDLSSSEGKDHVIEELRPAFATLGPSVLQEDLLALAADRLDIAPELARRLLYSAGGSGGRGGQPRASAGDSARGSFEAVIRRAGAPNAVEHAFLTSCLALSHEGQAELASLDLEKYFTDPLTREAATWLRDHPEQTPPDDQPEIAALVRELIAKGSIAGVTPASFEASRIKLELALIERQRSGAADQRARYELEMRRDQLNREFNDAVGRANDAQHA
jgi:DNA primase